MRGDLMRFTVWLILEYVILLVLAIISYVKKRNRLGAGILAFLCIVLFTNNLPLMLAGTIGLGLSLSGMYGTTVANAGDVFGRYPLAMGIFVTLSGIGSIVTPSVIGTVAESAGIRTGMRILLVPAVLLLAVAILNRGSRSK